MPRAWSQLLALLTLFLAPTAFAQIPNATDTTATPAPGGHDYLHAPLETVNPANGSVSIRIPVRLPQGRLLTVPFSFAYDSNGAHYIGELPQGSAPFYMTTTTTVGQRGGWSYSYPVLSFSSGTFQIPGSLDNQITCHGSTNYVFQDPNGDRHNLALSVSPNLASPDGFDNCNVGLQGDGEFTTGGEGSILATTSIPQNNTNLFPSVTVVDGDGTTYGLSGGSPGTNGLTTLATGVTDRNGNAVTISSSSGAVTYTDTIGRTVLHTSGLGGAPDTITVGGLASPYSVNWTTASANFTLTMLNLEPGLSQNCPTSMTGSAPVVSTIVLPNGRQFTLSYESTYGMLSKIVYPSGGYVRYVWSLSSQADVLSWTYAANRTTYSYTCRYDFPAVTDRYVSYDGSTEVLHQHFSYYTDWSNNTTFNWNYKTTTVTTYDLVSGTTSTTVYTYSPLNSPFVPNCGSCSMTTQMPTEQTIQYQNSGGTVLKTVTKSWKNIRLLQSEETTLNDLTPNISSLNVYCYNNWEQPTEVDEYDFGGLTPSGTCASVPNSPQSGALLRKTATTYATFTAHIVDLPATVITYDGSGTRVAETDSPSYDPNGNLLTQTRQCFAGGVACPQGNSTTQYTYDSHGQTLTMVDPKNNTTQFSYTDNYSGCGGSAPPTSPSDAFLTQVTRPPTNGVSHIVHFCYDYAKGLMLSATDENNQPTTYSYSDSLDRLTAVNYPDQGQTTYSYNDTPPSPTITTTDKMSGTQSRTAVTAMNGLGAATETQVTSYPGGTDTTSFTVYNGLGLTYKRYNPTQCNPPTTNCGESTWGFTQYGYDALGRTILVTNPDNSTINTSYTGRATQVTDESGKKRISQADGLGRLTSACEVTGTTLAVGISGSTTPASCNLDISGTGFLTSYSYDGLDDLTSVAQGPLNPRSFAYDSLGHLTSATNPESGHIAYTYDANGNLATKVAPLPNQTGSSTVTTTYTYDALNRLSQKTYSDGVTPTTLYGYDDTLITMGSDQFTTVNSNGRLSWSCVLASPSSCGPMFVFNYDPMGRISQRWQKNPVNNNNIEIYYSYDQLGDELTRNINSEGFSGTFDGAGHLTSFTQTDYTNTNNPANLLSAATYDPMGHMKFANLGNGLSETWKYDNRGRLMSEAVGTGCSGGTCTTTKYSASATYYPNGDVMSANDTANGNWVYTYDDFNRLASSVSGSNTYTYAYDRFGNRWNQKLNGGCTAGTSVCVQFDANNRMTNAVQTYDAAGNVLSDSMHFYAYDAESRLNSLDHGATTYGYDGSGQRVSRTTAGVLTDFIYDRDGHIILMNPSAPTQVELYIGVMHLATKTLNAQQNGTNTYFDHADWLGTERARTDWAGNLCETIASLPFGDGLANSSTCPEADVSPMHFTGKQRDTESGLDNFGARYDASSFARFMTPDWAAKPTAVPYAVFGDPQSLNLYGYVRNNPVTIADPDGHCDPGLNCFKSNLRTGLDQIANAYATAGKTVAGMATGAVNTLGTGVGEVVAGAASGNNQEIQQGINKIGATVTLVAVTALGDAPAAEGSGGLADSALVVRGGVPTAAQLTKGAESIAEDGTLNGVSVQSANGATVEQLSQGLPNNKVGVTTVGDVRAAGGDVVQTPEPNNPCHCDMNGVRAEKASQLFKVQPNPSKVKVKELNQ